MSPRAFPFPFNVGNDICQISRIARILATPRGPRFIERIFTKDELHLIPSGLENNTPPNPKKTQENGIEDLKAQKHLWKKASFVAGRSLPVSCRFAAKEATIKAHIQRRLTFHDINILRKTLVEGQANANGSGPPVAVIKGATEGERAQEAKITISHDGDYATAVCIAYEPPVEKGGNE
ncbi:Holo-[acyl-carrier-protein] synthase [Colletotrichum siamense]|uniref:Holo-[acyl-carrier-protein] synthase n=1 Tax=Colletotrichum siamense TaxID=690259 RepID=A0A9P5EVY5_COLSI|nr:Holo-[acyl-carrier-protein] synthase [Colletotrichum siamense]KAF4860475.1 Holo-[acyl-carrier-protein] synthase [Colletotrichum siamense]